MAEFQVFSGNFLLFGLSFWFFLVYGIVLLCLVIIKNLLWRKKISHLIPGSKPRFLNVFGNFIDLPIMKKSRNGYSILICLYQLLEGYSKIFAQKQLFCLWAFCHPVIVLTKADAVEAILGGTNATGKGSIYKWFQQILGDGILTSDGNKWKSRRKLLNPCFRYDNLKNFLPILNEHSQTLVERLKDETNKDFTRISKPLLLCAYDIICDTILGIQAGAQKCNQEPEIINCLRWSMRLITERTVNCFLWPDFIYFSTKNGKKLKKHVETFKNFTRSVIQEEKQKHLSKGLQKYNRKAKPLIHLLLEHHLQTKDFSVKDVEEELLTFMLAGQDTAATAVSWTLYLLGLYPDVQETVHEELDLIFGEDVDRHATEDDLKNMKYLDCVLKETQRLYPAAPVQARCLREATSICGYPIPKGSTCVLLTHILHRDEEIFLDPEKFDPNRFSPENTLGRHPYAYVPFSAGPRNCIGQKLGTMEQLVITSTILRNYKVESVDQRDEILPALSLALTTSKPLRIRIRPRHDGKT